MNKCKIRPSVTRWITDNYCNNLKVFIQCITSPGKYKTSLMKTEKNGIRSAILIYKCMEKYFLSDEYFISALFWVISASFFHITVQVRSQASGN